MNKTDLDLEKIGWEMHELISELYPIHRSITGEGVRQTLAGLNQHIPVAVHEIPSGTQVFDWQVPAEWEIRDAYIKDKHGNRVIDYRESNLHVVTYSQPVNMTMTWRDLKKHLISLPDKPHWIPYRTSYFQESWGFCVSHKQLQELEEKSDQAYEVCIDASFNPGSLTYGEMHLPGGSEDEILIIANVCHPSLANDGLSGVAVSTYLAKYLSSRDRRYTYRFIFIPATIGAISWLCKNEEQLQKIKHGLILNVLGDPGKSTYKKSRRGNAEIDRVVSHVLENSGTEYAIMDFEPIGYDERQFCSPAFNLPVGCLMRTPNGRYPEYHTSADNLELVHPEYLADSFAKCVEIINILENNQCFLNLNPKCEPQLGKRGLYRAYGFAESGEDLQQAVLWVLNLSDGNNALLDIAERSGFAFDLIKQATELLLKHKLLREC